MDSRPSPLTQLCSHLRSIVEKSIQFQSVLRASESATRAALIDPLLGALGWNVGDLNRVEIEKVKNNTRVDYLLKKPGEEVFAVVEAKSFASQLRSPDLTRQIGDYQRTFFTQDVWLTDGIQWLFYDNYDPAREPHGINLRNDNLADAGLYFLSHLDAYRAWQPGYDTGADTALLDRLRRAEDRLNELEIKFRTTPNAPSSLVPTPNLPILSVPTSAAWCEMRSCGAVSGTAVNGVRLPDGTELTVQRWNGVLQAVAEYYLAKQHDLAFPIFDSERNAMVLIGEDNAEFKACKPLSTLVGGRTLYLNTNYSANSIVAKCLYLLGRLSKEHLLVEPAVLLAVG